MLHIAATLHTFGLTVADRVRTRLADAPERGNVTIEHVLWAVAVIAIVGTVVAVITRYVTSEAGKIGP
jgi:heme/copper-type cytochrome/quinol oxidase subunit 2